MEKQREKYIKNKVKVVKQLGLPEMPTIDGGELIKLLLSNSRNKELFVNIDWDNKYDDLIYVVYNMVKGSSGFELLVRVSEVLDIINGNKCGGMENLLV